MCRHPECPEVTAKALFQAMSCCEDAGMAQRSFKTLATLCGLGDDAAMAGIRDVPSIGELSHLLRRYEQYLVSTTQEGGGPLCCRACTAMT